MTTQEWKDLPDLQWVATAQAEGWAIEFRDGSICEWFTWSGRFWNESAEFRGRPKQPKTKQVKILGWLTDRGTLVRIDEMRFSQLDFSGWRRAPSEDTVIEVEE